MKYTSVMIQPVQEAFHEIHISVMIQPYDPGSKESHDWDQPNGR